MAVGLVGILASLTANRIAVWGDAVALWVEAVQHSPRKPRSWINLGAALAVNGRLDEARLAYERAIGLSLVPERVRLEGQYRSVDVARLNLALMAAQAGRYQEALGWLAQIQPRQEQGSIVAHLERQWRHEFTSGQPFTGRFF